MTPVLTILATILVAQPAPAAANLKELGHALYGCFRAPQNSAGSQMTVRFSLNRDGAIFGRPMVTFSKLVGSKTDQQAFVASVLGALSSCTPVALSPSFGEAIAGRPISLRFVGGGPETRV